MNPKLTKLLSLPGVECSALLACWLFVIYFLDDSIKESLSLIRRHLRNRRLRFGVWVIKRIIRTLELLVKRMERGNMIAYLLLNFYLFCVHIFSGSIWRRNSLNVDEYSQNPKPDNCQDANNPCKNRGGGIAWVSLEPVVHQTGASVNCNHKCDGRYHNDVMCKQANESSSGAPGGTGAGLDNEKDKQ